MGIVAEGDREKEVAAGYLPIMPPFKNRLSEEEIFRLTAYIRSLAAPEAGAVRTPGLRAQRRAVRVSR